MQRIYRISSSSLIYLFYILLGLIPLVMFTKSTEIFELNKTVFLFISTILISLAWISKSISSRSILFRNSILTLPILLFLLSNLVSTYLSIDVDTSIFGYYGRFNGGMLSLICFSVVYFAYISNMGRHESYNSIIAILISSLFVSIYAIAQRFGIDDHLWAQDVVYRVFSTFGQPNWLSSWIAMITPLATVTYFWKSDNRLKNFLACSLPSIYLLVIILSKSRSGLVGFVLSLLFMLIYIVKNRKESIFQSTLTKYLVLTVVSMFIVFIFAGSPWSPSLVEFDADQSISEQIYDRRGDNTILTRKYVWIAAIESWEDSNLFGTGPETFAYVFPKYKPVDHNLTVEWSHVFNKAHNEYLNYLSNTGIFGLASYLFLVIASIYSFYKVQKSLKGKEKAVDRITNFALFTGFISVLSTNFVGFSTVTTNLFAFLFPAISVSLIRDLTKSKVYKSLAWQYLLIGISIVGSAIFIAIVLQFWLSDYFIAKADAYKLKASYAQSVYYTELALGLSDNAVVQSMASTIYSDYALSMYFDDKAEFDKYLAKSVSLSDRAISSSPNNLMLKIDKANLFLKLAAVDFKYLDSAIDLLTSILEVSPNDPKVWFNLGLAYAKKEDYPRAMTAFQQSSSLKPDYKNSRLGILTLCQKTKDLDCMKRESDYILENIDPLDQLSNTIQGQLSL